MADFLLIVLALATTTMHFDCLFAVGLAHDILRLVRLVGPAHFITIATPIHDDGAKIRESRY